MESGAQEKGFPFDGCRDSSSKTGWKAQHLSADSDGSFLSIASVFTVNSMKMQPVSYPTLLTDLAFRCPIQVSRSTIKNPKAALKMIKINFSYLVF